MVWAVDLLRNDASLYDDNVPNPNGGDGDGDGNGGSGGDDESGDDPNQNGGSFSPKKDILV